MSHIVALYTFGMFIERADHPNNAGFHERNDPIFLHVEGRPGFIARSGYADEPGPESWGVQVYPHYNVDRGDGWAPSTLSVWTDLESPMAFSYSGLHAEALAHGREWFQKPKWPPYVLWWISGDQRPTWQEGVERHEHLHDHGPTPQAFDFKQPFDATGQSTTIDRGRVKTMGAVNS
ncbi:MAG: DUF3291 domain-containing protein [Alphaproteobacteria bacterium]